jgi:AAA+ ATPase superfamily predicted ATPase
VLTETFKKILREEAHALREFAAGQKRLQELIGKRQWTKIETQIVELKSLASLAETLENQRFHTYQQLKASLGIGAERTRKSGQEEAESFAQIVTRLPHSDRDELFGLYRQLKLAVIRVKGNAGLLGFYLRSLSETLQKVLEELFPHRKGRIYSRSGKARDAGDDSLVIHRHV